MLLLGVFGLVGVMIYLQRQQAKAAGPACATSTPTKAQRQGARPDVRFSDVAGCEEAMLEPASSSSS